MATRPGYIWSGTEWVSIGQEAVVAPIAYQTSAPSTPSTGDIWIDSDDGVPSVNSTLYYRWKKTMSGGETSVSGTDDNSLTLAYTAGYESVFINGVLQVRGSDYTATDGTSVTGMTALTAGDIVMVESVVAYSVGDTYTQSTLDGKFSPITTTGLVLLSTTTIGSALTTVTVNNAFSAAYDNYRIVITGGTSSTNTWGSLQLGSSTTGYYAGAWEKRYTSSTTDYQTASNASNFSRSIGMLTTNIDANIDIKSPFLSKYTIINYCFQSGNDGNYNGGGQHKVASSYTDFTIATESGTFTGGTIKVYGYK